MVSTYPKKEFRDSVANREPGSAEQLPPAWRAMIEFCRELGYGEIACIKIHDGLPISAEIAIKKVRWS